MGRGPDHYSSYRSIDVAAAELEPFYNIAQAGTEQPAQSLKRAPGPMGKGFGQWRPQVSLVRAAKAYHYSQALDTSLKLENFKGGFSIRSQSTLAGDLF